MFREKFVSSLAWKDFSGFDSLTVVLKRTFLIYVPNFQIIDLYDKMSSSSRYQRTLLFYGINIFNKMCHFQQFLTTRKICIFPSTYPQLLGGRDPPFTVFTPPFHTSKIKDEKNRECGGECGELEGVLSPSTGIHIWLSKVNSSSRLPRHIKMLYLVIHASMKVKALQKNIHNRRYR